MSTILTLAGAVSGLIAAGLYHRHYMYEVLNYEAFGFQQSIIPLSATLFGHLLFWWWVKPGQSWLELARACRVLVLLNFFFLPLKLGVNLGFSALHLHVAVIGISAAWATVGSTRSWDWAHGPRVAWGLAGCLALVFVAWSTIFQEFMYHRLLLGYSDLGYIYKRLTNTLNGDFLLLYETFPRYWDHLCPGLVLLLPVFALWPTVHCLMIIQPVLIASTGLIIFAIGRKHSAGSAAPLALLAAYFAAPAINQLPFSFSYGIHAASLAMPFLAWSVYLLYQGRLWAAVLPALIVCSVQEHLAVYYIGAGAMLMSYGRYRAGLAWATVSTAYVLWVFIYFMPGHTGGENVHVAMWGALGNSVPEIAMTTLTKPWKLLGLVLTPAAGHLWLMLLLPLGLISLRRPRLLLVIAAVAVFNAVRGQLSTSIALHYQTGTLAVLYLAAALALWHKNPPWPPRLGRLERWIAERKLPTPRVWLAAALMAAWVSSAYAGLLPWSSRSIGIIPEGRRLVRNAHAFRMIQELVPNHASVAADDRCLSAVLDRPMATFFHHEEAAKAEYFVLLEDGWNTAPADIAKLVGALKLQHNLELLKHDFGVYVLKRRPTPTADSAPE